MAPRPSTEEGGRWQSERRSRSRKLRYFLAATLRRQHALPTRVNALAGRAPVMACLQAKRGAILHSAGITSISDCGTGDLGVSFATDAEEPYHVSVQPNGRQANVVEQTPGGFRVQTADDQYPGDLNIAVLRTR